MNWQKYNEFSQKSLKNELFSKDECLEVLRSPDLELLPLLQAAFEVRQTFHNKEVTVHIINNAQNGHCPEDCHYCAQAKSSKADIESYPVKSEKEVLAEAKAAYEGGAHRYCMVFAGRGPNDRRTEQLASLVRQIKANYPIEVCVSAGLVGKENAQKLKDAGVDRLNHNLNTSRRHYPNICTTHTYQDRLDTLQAARLAGIQLCSGLIAGMGESDEDLINVALELRELDAESIPVNFLVPIEGNQLDQPNLTPEFCLRVLCLFRFLNPKAEIRIAAGREIHLRGMEVMALYPANSLFLQGYLNTKGSSRTKTLRMIKDAGFIIKSDQDLDDLLRQEEEQSPTISTVESQTIMKDLDDLRPYQSAMK